MSINKYNPTKFTVIYQGNHKTLLPYHRAVPNLLLFDASHEESWLPTEHYTGLLYQYIHGEWTWEVVFTNYLMPA